MTQEEKYKHFFALIKEGEKYSLDNSKESRRRSIKCFMEALFGNGDDFEGFYIKSLFEAAMWYVKTYYELFFDKIFLLEFLGKTNGIADKLDSYVTNKVIDTAVSNHVQYSIRELIEQAKRTERYDDILKNIERLNLPDESESNTSAGRIDFAKRVYGDIFEHSLDENEIEYEYIQKSKNIQRIARALVLLDSDNVELHRKLFDISAGICSKWNKIAILNENNKLLESIKNKDADALPFINSIDIKISKSNQIGLLYNYLNNLNSLSVDSKLKRDLFPYVLKRYVDKQIARISDVIVIDTPQSENKVIEYCLALVLCLAERQAPRTDEEDRRARYNYIESVDKKENKKELLTAVSQTLDNMLTGSDDMTPNSHRNYIFESLAIFLNKNLHKLKNISEDCCELLLDVASLYAQKIYFEEKYSSGNPEFLTAQYKNPLYCAQIFWIKKVDAEAAGNSGKWLKYANISINAAQKVFDTKLYGELKELYLRELNGIRFVINKSKDEYKHINELIEKQIYNPDWNAIVELTRNHLNEQQKIKLWLISRILLDKTDKDCRWITGNYPQLEVLVNIIEKSGTSFLHIINELPVQIAFFIADNWTLYFSKVDLPNPEDNEYRINDYSRILETVCKSNYGEIIVNPVLVKAVCRYLKEFPSHADDKIKYKIADLMKNLSSLVVKASDEECITFLLTEWKDTHINSPSNEAYIKLWLYATRYDLDLTSDIINNIEAYFWQARKNRYLNNTLWHIFDDYKITDKKLLKDALVKAQRSVDFYATHKNKDTLKGMMSLAEALIGYLKFQISVSLMDEAAHTIWLADELIEKIRTVIEHDNSNIKEKKRYPSVRKMLAYAKSYYQQENTEINRAIIEINKREAFWEIKQKEPDIREQIVGRKLRMHSTAATVALFRDMSENEPLKYITHPVKETNLAQQIETVGDYKKYISSSLISRLNDITVSNTLARYLSEKILTVNEHDKKDPDIISLQKEISANVKVQFSHLYKEHKSLVKDAPIIPPVLKTFSDGDMLNINPPDWSLEKMKFRLFLPSLKDAVELIISETKEHRIDRINVDFLQGRDKKSFIISFTIPDVDDIKKFDSITYNIMHGNGGNFDIVKSLWGLCDFAIEVGSGNKTIRHEDILGHIDKQTPSECLSDYNGGWLRYLIRVQGY